MPKPVTLPDDLACFAEAKVAAGRYASVEEVLRAGAEALEAREEAEQEWVAYARQKWDEGVESSRLHGSVRMTEHEFSAFLDECVNDTER